MIINMLNNILEHVYFEDYSFSRQEIAAILACPSETETEFWIKVSGPTEVKILEIENEK